MQLTFFAPMTDEERIKFLREEISKHDQKDLSNKSTISDTGYDKLYRELLQLELKHPECYSQESPTQKIHYVKVPGLKEVPHSQKMLSLGKINMPEELKTFYRDYPYELIAEWKEDGGTIVLTYQNGHLVDAVTLGDGIKGQSILHNAKVIPTIPNTIPYQEGEVVFRGECIIPYAEFEALNHNGDYANPRNLACASFTMLDSKEAALRGLKFILFDVITDIEGITTEEEALLWGQSQGFVLDEYRIIHNEEELLHYINECEHVKRPLLDHQVDGAVIKINNRKIRKSQGTTNKYPKGSIAYKFVASEEKTRLLDIVWSIGKSGQLCPNAVLDTVNIDGSNVSAATLHNWKYICERDIRIGDMVSVIKANDVIPKVVSAYKDDREGDEKAPLLPDVCPLCGGKVAFQGEHLFCQNEFCESQVVARLQHFISKPCLNMKNFGDETLFLFYQNGYVHSYKDIFHLGDYKKEILNLDKFGAKKVKNILDGIEIAKSTTIHQFLYSLSIKWLGEKASGQLEKEFKTMDAILEAFTNGSLSERLYALPDIGPVLVESFTSYLNKNLSMIQELMAEGITFEKVEEIVVKEDSPIKDKHFVVTGDVQHYPNRKALQLEIEALGGKVVGSVSKNTHYLINNDTESSSSKNKKAKELNIPIISEDDFLKMIVKVQLNREYDN